MVTFKNLHTHISSDLREKISKNLFMHTILLESISLCKLNNWKPYSNQTLKTSAVYLLHTTSQSTSNAVDTGLEIALKKPRFLG